MRFVLGLSGWTTNDWTSGSNLELLSGAFVADLRASARILEHLKKQHLGSFDELSRLVEISRPALIGSLHHLAQQGQVIFDFATRQYRFREVMPVALSEAVLGPPSPELTSGIETYKRGGVSLERREVLPHARQLLIAQVRPEASRSGSRCEAEDEGFALNPKKGRAQGRGGRQDVTGIVVNVKPNLPRDELKRLRAILHQAKKTGLEAQNREKVPDYRRVLEGQIAYVMMVDRAKGQKLKAALDGVTG